MSDYDKIAIELNKLTERISRLEENEKVQEEIIRNLRNEITSIKRYEWGEVEDPPTITDLC